MSHIEKREITSELQESYLDYAMSVIVSRALPDVRDGLKPVQRRILWDMWESGLTHTAKFRKSANVVGETMARYHPHGDAAIYDTLVRMAQDFSLRYPLVEGQGNFGSLDGDPPAALRYTEARLSRISEELLLDIEKETVDWQPNYDANREEPKVLPAKLPNLLLNGTVGIAVGMATSIPPHNLGEVVDAILCLIDNGNATSADLMKFVKGPDFPTGGLIFNAAGIKEGYISGKGTVTMRAKVDMQEKKNNRQPVRPGRPGGPARPKESGRSSGVDIVVTEIPYQVNKAELIKRIAELVQAKKIEGIRDLRDESSREGLRIVVELKNDVTPQKVLNQLYSHTDLQKDFHMNMIALMDGGLQPQLLSLKDILAAYIEYRNKVVRRRTEFDLKKAQERAHILEGLHRALGSIDRVIATIKKSKDRDDAHVNLKKLLEIDDLQATAILEMRLQTLAALEREKIESELKEKLVRIKELELILKSPAKILKIIKDEVSELKTKYGDERRTQVVSSPLAEFKEEDLIPEEEVIITLSAGGYIKRLPPDAFRKQRRGGKGLIGSDVADEDFLTQFLNAKTHDNLLFFTDQGRVFQTRAYEIPAASRISKGRAIHNFLELPADEGVSAIVSYADSRGGERGSTQNGPRISASNLRESAYVMMVTKAGLIKKTPLEDFTNIRRTGIIAVALEKGDELKWVRFSSGKDQVLLVTRLGQAIRFKESQIRPMGRTARGVRAIRLRKDDEVAGFDTIRENPPAGGSPAAQGRVLVVMANGFAKQTRLKEYKVQKRGGSGIRTAKITAKTGKVIGGKIIGEETEIFALSAKGQMIRTGLESVRTTGRAAQGVKIMNIKSGDSLAGAVIV